MSIIAIQCLILKIVIVIYAYLNSEVTIRTKLTNYQNCSVKSNISLNFTYRSVYSFISCCNVSTSHQTVSRNSNINELMALFSFNDVLEVFIYTFIYPEYLYVCISLMFLVCYHIRRILFPYLSFMI